MWFVNSHASELEAVGSLLSVLVGIVTIVVLWKTKRAAENAASAAQEQAQAARSQVASAEEATKLTVLQLEAALDSADAQRQHSHLLQEQVNASLRPLLVFKWRENQYENAALRNDSATGIASEIHVTRQMGVITDDLSIELNIIGPGCEAILLDMYKSKFQPGTYFAFYESADGRRFVTEAQVDLGTKIFRQQSRQLSDGQS